MEKNKSTLTMSALAALLLFTLMLTNCQLLGDDIETLREKARAKDSGGSVAGGSVSDGSDILNTWDDTKGWNLTEAGITADNFSNSGINGISNGNFDGIVEWFNNLTSSGSAPKNLDELKILVDAALIGIASDDADFLDAGNYADRADVEKAIKEILENYSGVTFEWTSDDTVIVRVGDYEVEFVFDNDIPDSAVKCPVCGEDPCVCDGDQSTLNISNFIVSDDQKTYNGGNQSVAISYSGEGINTTTAGTITIYYSGSNGTTHAESTTAPVNAGTYDVKAETNGGTVYAAFGKATVGSLTISKATGSFAAPGAISTTYTAGMMLANVNLPDGYEWNNPVTGLNAGDGQQFPAAYTNPNGNYMAANGNITVNVAKAVGAAVVAPILASRTNNSITINAVNSPGNGQTVEYTRNAVNTAPETGWQTGLSFSGLSTGTSYYIFARSVENSNYNAGASAGTAITTLTQESYTITFAQLQDFAPNITGPTIQLIGSAAETTKTITVANPGQYDSGSIKWYINSSPITTGVSGTYNETLTINSTTYSGIGKYPVVVEVKKDGELYSKIVTFEVRP